MMENFSLKLHINSIFIIALIILTKESSVLFYSQIVILSANMMGLVYYTNAMKCLDVKKMLFLFIYRELWIILKYR